MQEVVEELAALAGAEMRGHEAFPSATRRNVQPRMALTQGAGQVRKKPVAALPAAGKNVKGSSNSKKPEEVIPLGDEDFEDF